MAASKARLSIILAFLCMTLPVNAEPIRVETRAVLLAPGSPDTRTAGTLRFLGGLEMASPDGDFGGFSALSISADGKHMIALSDAGRRLAANLIYNEKGDLSGIANTVLDALSAPDGTPLRRKRDSDAEAMALGVEGEIIVAFERDHRLWRYLPGEIRPRPMASPAELNRLPKNSGIEALTSLNDGALLAISEGPKGGGDAIAWISDPRGWSVITYGLADGFRATGAATLPGGDVLVLERRYTLRDGVAARVRQLSANSIKAGAHLSGTLIAEIRPPMTADNFEGIDVRRDETDRTLVYMISDDNFNPLQRNLLMMFELME
ncbi:MAG: esterase-like activity of phytase family protein [Rhodospirillaceae bacterium]|nr:esterase-like activity of phytase family protein [Rhodospirillaceae bacterium]